MNGKMKVALLGAALSVGTTACLANIRPEGIRSTAASSQTMQPEKDGKELLKKAFSVVGGDTYRNYQSVSIHMTDEWVGLFARAGNPWPMTFVDVDWELELGKIRSRATFRGEKEGLVWGVDGKVPYEIVPGQEREVGGNEDIRFILSAIQYFFEFPSVVQTHPFVAYGGTENVRGIEYDRVYTTWGNGETTADWDQYLSYIHPKTGRIEKLRFTVRDAGRIFDSAMHFSDYRQVDGVWVPHKMEVTWSIDDDPNDFLHQILVKQVRFHKKASGELALRR